MTRNDLRILSAALGFLAVVLKDEPVDRQAEWALGMAELIECFCIEQLPEAFDGKTTEIKEASKNPSTVYRVNVTDIAEIDATLDKHIHELRSSEATILPQDRAMLLAFYERLQQRQTRRMRSAFYETASTDMIANAVLAYLDEEIANMKANA